MPFPNGSFSGVVAFTMLHHVPTAALQDRLLADARRVLRPGGVFAGFDGVGSFLFRLIHLGDTYTPVNPDTFGRRLEAAGQQVEVGPNRVSPITSSGNRLPNRPKRTRIK